jgi:hypothetical protein
MHICSTSFDRDASGEAFTDRYRKLEPDQLRGAPASRSREGSFSSRLGCALKQKSRPSTFRRCGHRFFSQVLDSALMHHHHPCNGCPREVADIIAGEWQ